MRTIVNLCALAFLFWGSAYAQINSGLRAGAVDGGLPVRTLKVDGLERTYRVYAPRGQNEPMPLVFVLHGGGMGERVARQVIGYTRFIGLARSEKFIVVYPVGVGGNWNDGRGSKFIRAQKDGVDDVKFLRTLVDVVAERYPVDRSRIFSTGISNGAFMSHRLAAEASDLVAAISSVVGSVSPAVAEKFNPTYPVSLFVIQGDADPLLSVEGGQVGLGKLKKRGEAVSLDETIAGFLKALEIKQKPTVNMLPDRDPDDGTTTESRIYPAGKGGARVQVYLVKGGGHTWPGSRPYLTESLVGKTARDFDATEAIWQFFKACPGRVIKTVE